MPAFTGRIQAGFPVYQYEPTGNTVDWTAPTDRTGPIFTRDLKPGTGVNQANIVFKQERNITSGGTFTLDLNGATNADIFGVSLAMTQLVALYIVNGPVDEANNPANTTTVTVTTTLVGLLGGTSPSIIMAPGESVMMANTGVNGLCTVTPTSADTITFTNASGAAAKVQICAIGRG
jgi:hypothetical protein